MSLSSVVADEMIGSLMNFMGAGHAMFKSVRIVPADDFNVTGRGVFPGKREGCGEDDASVDVAFTPDVIS